MHTFETALIDRFGALPQQVIDLLDSVRIKWLATKFGIEKLVLRQGKMIGYFVQDQQSKFYQSDAFTRVLQFVQTHPHHCKMKEKQTRNGLRLLISFDAITSTEKALKALSEL